MPNEPKGFVADAEHVPDQEINPKRDNPVNNPNYQFATHAKYFDNKKSLKSAGKAVVNGIKNLITKDSTPQPQPSMEGELTAEQAQKRLKEIEQHRNGEKIYLDPMAFAAPAKIRKHLPFLSYTANKDAKLTQLSAYDRLAPKVDLSPDQFKVAKNDDARKSFDTQEKKYQSILTAAGLDPAKVQANHDTLFDRYNALIELSCRDSNTSARYQARADAFNKGFKTVVKELKQLQDLQRREIDASTTLTKDQKEEQKKAITDIHNEQRKALEKKATDHKAAMLNAMNNIQLNPQRMCQNVFLSRLPSTQRAQVENKMRELQGSDDPNKPLKVSTETKLETKHFAEAVDGMMLQMRNGSGQTLVIGKNGVQSMDSDAWAKWNHNPSYWEKDIEKAAEEFAEAVLAAGMSGTKVTAPNEIFLRKVASKLLSAGMDPDRITLVNNSGKADASPRKVSDCQEDWAMQLRELDKLQKQAHQTPVDRMTVGGKSDFDHDYKKSFAKRAEKILTGPTVGQVAQSAAELKSEPSRGPASR